MAKFYGHELVLGQVNLLFAVIVLLARSLVVRAGREAAAGLLVALAVVVKPYAVIFLPWLGGAARPRRALAAALAGMVAALLAAGRAVRRSAARSSCTATGGGR